VEQGVGAAALGLDALAIEDFLVAQPLLLEAGGDARRIARSGLPFGA
jgi:hypothetical protein